MIEDFLKAVKDALKVMEEYGKKEVTLFHHNDCDGLTSGSILEEAFRREGYSVKRYSLEKPYPAVLNKIFEQENEFIVFTDFAGRIAPIISDLNKGRNLVFILDHHVAEEATDTKVYNLDPELYGLKGDRDITASVVCYLFARTMDEDNRDLSRIGALGAVGDGFFINGRLVSANRDVALEAVKLGFLDIVERDDGGEDYIWKFKGKKYKCRELGGYLDVLGGVGYMQGGPDIGVKVCLNGPDLESDNHVESLKAIMDRIFAREMEGLRNGGLNVTEHIQWFNLENRFTPMGVKMVGVFCKKLKSMDFVDPNKYIAGFQHIPPTIPNFGRVDIHDTKISMRVPKPLEKAIVQKEALGLDVLLPEATGRIGGFSDACHSLTAATVVKIGDEKRLVDEMEKILREKS